MDEFPDHVTDEYQQDPYKQISKAKYLNMMICHAISTNNELKFMKLISKFCIIKSTSEDDEKIKENMSLL